MIEDEAEGRIGKCRPVTFLNKDSYIDSCSFIFMSVYKKKFEPI